MLKTIFANYPGAIFSLSFALLKNGIKALLSELKNSTTRGKLSKASREDLAENCQVSTT